MTPAGQSLVDLFVSAQQQMDAARQRAADDPAQAPDQTALILALLASLRSAAQDWAAQDLPAVYAGAAVAVSPGWSWPEPDVAVMNVLAADAYSDLDNAIAKMERATRSFRGRLVRLAALPPDATGVQIASRQQLTIRYANGAKVPLATYARMLVQTRETITRNAGTLNTLSARGDGWVLVYDGPGCGWTTHDDPDLANGSVRTIEDAYAHVLAHPNCQRGFIEGADPSTPTEAESASPTEAAAAAQELAYQQGFTGGGGSPRDRQAARRAAPRTTGRATAAAGAAVGADRRAGRRAARRRRTQR